MQTADFFGNEGPGSLALIGALCFFQKRHVEEKRPKGPNKGVVVCLSGGRGICTHSLSAGYTMISIQGKPLLHSDCISRHIAAPVSQISGFSCLADYARTNPLWRMPRRSFSCPRNAEALLFLTTSNNVHTGGVLSALSFLTRLSHIPDSHTKENSHRCYDFCRNSVRVSTTRICSFSFPMKIQTLCNTCLRNGWKVIHTCKNCDIVFDMKNTRSIFTLGWAIPGK